MGNLSESDYLQKYILNSDPDLQKDEKLKRSFCQEDSNFMSCYAKIINEKQVIKQFKNDDSFNWIAKYYDDETKPGLLIMD